MRTADELLNREPGEEYIKRWTKLLARKHDPEEREKFVSLLLFRLKGQWMALATSCFKEILEVKPVHRVPFRNNPLLQGLINVGGQLKVSVYLDRLLKVSENADITEIGEILYKRMIVIRSGEETWVFPSDEVHGIFYVDPLKIENVPVSVLKSDSNYFNGIFNWHGRDVAILDHELLFKSLRKAV